MRSALVCCVVLASSCGRLGFDAGTARGGDDAAVADGPDRPGDAPADARSDGPGDGPAAIAIAQSGVFVGDSQLARTLAVSTSDQVFTISTWYKSDAENQMPICAGKAANDQSFVWASQTDGRVLLEDQVGSATYYVAAPDITTWPYRGTWIHLVISVDLTAADEADRVRIWLDGVPQAVTPANGSAFPQGTHVRLGETVAHTIGSKYNGDYPWTGKLAETYVIWGHALDASAFVTGSGSATRSIAYTGPIEAESVHFDYAVPGENLFSGEPDWTSTNLTGGSDVPY